MVKQLIKKIFLGVGRRGRRIPLGLYRGLVLSIDPRSEGMFFLGLYEAETNSWLKEAGAKARSLVDVGTGCGELAIWGLRQPKIERVLAYDASPQRWPVFEENLRLNGMTEDERLTAVADYFPADGDPQIVIGLMAALPEPVLLKIDVDGGEAAILRHMQPVLKDKEMLIMIETHSQALDASCFEILSGCGYSPVRVAAAWWRRFVPERRPIDFNQWIVAAKERGKAEPEPKAETGPSQKLKVELGNGR